VRRGRVVVGILGAITLVVVIAALRASATPAAPGAAPCNLVPQLRDVTINQGLGGYSPLVNGKETLVRFYLSLPSCAGSGSSIQIVGGTLTLSGGASGTIAAPTPVPTAPAYPVIATNGVAPVADSTGDPRFVVPGSMLSKTAAFTANLSTTLTYQARASKSNPYGPVQQVTFSTRPGTSTTISVNFDRPSNALAVLFVPMGDAAKTYNTQWTTTGQQALQDGMTAAVSREYPLPAGIGNLGGTGGLRYAVAPTLIDLRRLNLLDSSGKFCGNGANYDAIQAQLAQFRLSYNTVNPNAQANRVVGVVDPAVGIDGPAVNQPCFEGMAVVNSQQAWALALPGRAGQLIGIEMAHTLGLVPPDRESPFDGAHSQNITAENPSLNRRFNVVQRSFIPTDRSLMKPTATNPAPDNVDTLLEVPDFAFLLCVMGGTVNPECQTYGQPGSVNANAPVGSTVAFVMSGTTDSSSTASLCSTCTGEAGGTSVVESYFGSVPLTIPSSTSTYRFVQRNSAGAIVSNQGVPVTFGHSEHGTGTSTNNHTSGLFSFALPFQTTTNRVELWTGSPGASGSRLLYAQNSSAAPQVTGFTVGNVIPFLLPGRKPARARVPAISQAVETLSAQTDAPTAPTTITPSSSLNTTVSFGNSFSSISDVCVNWYFVGDLFDPGETVSVTLGNSGGGGAGNTVGGSRRTQQLCMGAQADKDVFLDGTEPLTFSVQGGSVTIGAVLITVTGDSTAPVGYRISSDAPSYTVAQGSSVPIATMVTDDPDAAAPPGVDLTAQPLVPSGGFSTTPSSGTPTFTSNGTLATSASTPPDSYYLVVTGKGGGFNRSYAVPVTVTASGGGGGAPQAGPTFTVNTNTDPSTPLDTGCTATECTLREAIEAANADPADNTIQFSLAGSTEIDLGSALPAIVGKVAILGSSQPAGQVTVNGASVSEGASAFLLGDGSDGSEIHDLAIDHFSGGVGIEVVSASNSVSGNDISAVDTGIYVHGPDASANQIGGARSDGIGNRIWGFVSFGIHLDTADTGNTVQGNTIGLDASGDASGGSTGLSVDATSGTVVGSDVGPSELANVNYDFGNVVVAGTDGDGAGILITNQATGTILAGNFIGTDDTQTATNLGNLGVGIDVSAGSDGNQIGPGNIVAFNGGPTRPGARVTNAVGDRIVANSIHDNGGLGIVLSNGNDGLASPQLGSASISAGTTTVSGKISGVPAGNYFVEFFKNGSCDFSGSGEGETYLDFATVTVSGSSAGFSKTLGGLALDDVVTATLTGTTTNDTSEFSNCVTVQEQQSLPPDQEPFTATASDDHPADARLDGFLDCPGQPVQVIFVGRRPDSVDNANHTATWSGTIDTSLAPPHCNVEVAVNDGFTRPPVTPTGTQTADAGNNPVVAAISSPRAGARILQYGLVPLRGLVLNAQGVVGSGAHEWSLSGPGITRSGTGPIVDLQPPTGGWPVGSYTATLEKSGSTGPAERDSVTFNIVADADNDGIPASVESSSCFGTGGDNDPTNAYGDQDADGIPNVDDPQPCTPASSYTAIVDVNPDPLPTGSSGSPITANVRVPGRNVSQVLGSSVRITGIAGIAVSSNNDLKSTNWTVSNGVGTAKFDRQKIVQYLATNGIHNRVISITIGGTSSGSPPWSFSGSDSVFVKD
jgi:CSLREA domain-containing protein